MPAIAVQWTFGGFGDIVTVIQLATSIVSALKDVSKATQNYQELINDVETIRLTLQTLTTPDFNQADVAVDLRNGLKHAISLCHNIFSEMNATIDKYRKQASSSNTGWLTRFRGVTTPFWWTTVASNEIVAYRKRLSEQIIFINTLLLVANRCVLISFTVIYSPHL